MKTRKFKDGEIIGTYHGVKIVCKYECPPDTIYFLNDELLGEALIQSSKVRYENKFYARLMSAPKVKEEV